MNKIKKYYYKKIEYDKVYKRALNGGDCSIWEWNINTDKMFISKKIKKITGYEFNYIKNMTEFINIIVYEEDKILAMKDLDDYIKGSLPFYQSTFRIRTQRGEIRWVLFKGKIFKNKGESNNLFSGVMSDVTENKLFQRCGNLTKFSNREFLFEKLNNLVKINKTKISETYFRKILIESELKNSIDNNELYVFYQPQIDTLNNKIIGIEALLRWDNNKLGDISPDEFIPIAENIGYIIQIGDWVLDKVLKKACMWKAKGYKFNTISVNVSPIQIKESDFKDKILNTCTKYSISPSSLEIEITEGTLVDICKNKIDMLNQLIQNGVNIAIDDFGTGYSSLSYLTVLPVNTLKIDKLFVDNIENNKNKAVIKSIVNLSKSLKYKVITEGVETKEQLDLLTDLGCNIIQGYYFSKPLAENEMNNLLKSETN